MKNISIDFQPIQKENRIAYLDVLRGIAIFFIFTANIPYLSGFNFFREETLSSGMLLPTDNGLEFLLNTLVDGKFYTVFSLLFGIGITIQYENLKAKNMSFRNFFKKRMFWLLVIGGIHLMLFWAGDILSLYAILGFGLLLCIHLKNKTLIYWAIILLLLSIANTILIHYFHLDYPIIFLEINAKIAQYFHLATSYNFGNVTTDFQTMFKNENLLTFFQTNISNVFVRIFLLLIEGRPFKVFGIFLLGIWFGRKILYFDLLHNIHLLKKIALYGLLIGLPISILRTALQIGNDGSILSDLYITISYALGTVPLALGYFAGLALLYQKRKNFLNYFAPVGKMALTNYLFQTFISILIFYNIGFGLVGKFGFTILTGIVILIFIGQILLSKLWLSYFKFGPLEWVWRQLTYNKIMNIKK